MLEFEEIFGPGEFDNEENRYERTFPSVDAGGTQHVLDFNTLWEHANRRGYDVEPSPNGSSKDLKIENGKIEAYIQNMSDGRTNIKIDFDDEINDIEAYMEASVDQWLGEIIRREQKAFRAATNYVHNILPEKASEQGLKELEVLEKDLDFPNGSSLNRFHEEYRTGGPNDLGMNYAVEFEVWPFEKGIDRSDMPGKMPSADEINDPELKARNDLYQRKYIDSIVKEAVEEYGGNKNIRAKWLDYVDAGFS